MSLLKVENLSIQFGGLKAVNNISFDIKEVRWWVDWP